MLSEALMSNAGTSPDQDPSQLSLALTFGSTARELAKVRTEREAWEVIVRIGVKTVAGAEAAGITILRRGKFETVAPSNSLPKQVDTIQYTLRSGPSVDAILERTIFRTGDLQHDERWPEFGQQAFRQHGVLSMLSFRLYLEEDADIAGLNFYSTQGKAFDESSELIGGVFATHAAIALAAARRHEQNSHLHEALASNRDIGVAMGILMQGHLLTRQQAFDLLRMASQHSHHKLRDIALTVTETGTLDFPAALGSG
jgi:GAF domain-containing protein